MDNRQEPFSTYLPLSVIKRLRKASQDTGLKMYEIIKQAAELWLKANNA